MPLKTAAALAFLWGLVAAPASAEWVAADGEQVFTAEQPEAEACRLAEERAKRRAVVGVLGERIAVDELELCPAGTSDCTLAQLVWTSAEGEVRALRSLERRVEPTGVEGVRRCRVRLEAEVARWRGESDPSFDMTVTLTREALRPGEAVTLEIVPSQPMHVAVFQWSPYETGARQVTRIFPNPLDRDSRFNGKGSIPTPDGGARYAIRASFPTSGHKGAMIVAEYLLVVGTRMPMQFRESYAIEEFKDRLLELPRSQFRLVRRSYAVVRPQ